MILPFYYIQKSQEALPRVRHTKIFKLASASRTHLTSLREINKISKK